MVPEIWCLTDRWTDRKKGHMEVGAPPKKNKLKQILAAQKNMIISTNMIRLVQMMQDPT